MSSILPETGDSDFSLREFQDKVNSELVDKYGNYIYRMESFIAKNDINIKIPEEFDADDQHVLDELNEKFQAYRDEISNVHIKRGLQIWLELTMLANNYFNRSEPWKLIKTNRKRCNNKIFVSLKIAQYLTLMLYPYVPSGANDVWKTMFSEEISGDFDDLLSMNNFSINKGEPPFHKLDLKEYF